MSQRVVFPLILIWLGIGWGSTQPLGKIATTGGAGPFGLIFWQSVICVVLLGAITLARGRGLVFTRRALTFYAVVAVIGTLIPNTTFYVSVTHLPSGIMSIIISTIPLMAFPMALALGMERFQALRLVGLGLGLCGVALIALPRASLPDPAMAAFLPLAMVGPLFYAMEATFVARFGTAGMDPVQAMFGVSVAAMLLSLPVMLTLGQGFVPWPVGKPEAALIASSALHGLLYSTYVWLAARAGSVFASQSTYLVTASGVFWAMLLLGERFSPMIWVALVVMLAGVALVSPRGKRVEV
ncbi:RhaT Permeases of the drug/metabolite transporter (DMT) superfamily [Paracoccaceae bacterium]|jgi:drug/metabolite transporter (DMT)-like permease